MTFAALTETPVFSASFEMQYHFVFHRLREEREDVTFTAGPTFSELVVQAGEYWGRFEGQVHTSAGDCRSPTGGIFRIRIPHVLAGEPGAILDGAEMSVKIEAAAGVVFRKPVKA